MYSVFLAGFNCLHCLLPYYCNASQHSGSCILFSQLCIFLPAILGGKKMQILKRKSKMTQQWQTQWSNSQFWSPVCGIFSIRTFWCMMRLSCIHVILLTAAVMQDQCIAMTALLLSEMWIQEHFWTPKSVHVPSQHLCTKHKSQMGSLSVFSGCQHPCAFVGC